MKHPFLFLFFLGVLVSCNTERPTQFSEQALNDIFLDLEGKEISFQQILNKNKGQTILVDIWASWCRDCIITFNELKEFQDENNDIEYVFLSMDRSVDSWKAGIQKYNIEGQHYYMVSGWDGGFGDFIDLDWIPRYIIIDKEGKILHFKSIRINDLELQKVID